MFPKQASSASGRSRRTSGVHCLEELSSLCQPPTHRSTTRPFRSLISYFVRRRHDAFGDPFIHHSRQSTWDKQLHVALLLGLEWRHAVHWQQIKDRGRDLAKLRKLVDQGTVPGLAASTSIGELEAERVARTQEIDDSSMALETFKVHPQYDSIETEANQLTEALHQAVNARVSASRRLKLYRRAVESEEPPSGVAVEPMYEEMGVVFSEAIRRSLAEAKQFYGRVVRDRRRFLQDEITRLERESAEIQVEIAELTEQRAGVLRVLEEHGALAELTSLRERHATKLEELAGITRQIERRREIEADNRRIARDRAELADRAARDYDERRGSWDAAVRLFNRNSQALYAAPGHLVIDATDSGFKFDIDIRKSRSDGIGKMKIFCFDLAVLEACAGRDMGIGFLIHDSEMYDGVDSRQRAAGAPEGPPDYGADGYTVHLRAEFGHGPQRRLSRRIHLGRVCAVSAEGWRRVRDAVGDRVLTHRLGQHPILGTCVTRERGFSQTDPAGAGGNGARRFSRLLWVGGGTNALSRGVTDRADAAPFQTRVLATDLLPSVLLVCQEAAKHRRIRPGLARTWGRDGGPTPASGPARRHTGEWRALRSAIVRR